MKKLYYILILLLLLIGIKSYSQLENIHEDTMYMPELQMLIEVDSTSSINGYPRGEANYYIWYHYFPELNSTKMLINRVTEKRLKIYIFDTLQLPVVKVNIDSVIKYSDFKQTIENQIKNKGWCYYLKNNNLWMFNFNKDVDTLYTMNHIWKFDSLGGKIWNFDLFGVVAYANMDEMVGGYTIRQICNSMDFICKRKSNNQISVHLKRKNGEYPNWDEIKLLDNNYFTIATLSDFRTYYTTYAICEVDDVDEDITDCTPIFDIPVYMSIWDINKSDSTLIQSLLNYQFYNMSYPEK